MAIVDLGSAFKVSGKAQTAGGMPVDRVIILDVETGDRLWTGQPAAISWESDQIQKARVGGYGIAIAYFGDSGYGTVAHGPYSIGTPVDVDPYWTGVASLLRFAGADGQTWLYDDAGKFVAARDGAAITTARKKFGSSSLTIPSGGYLEGLDGAPLAANAWMMDNLGSGSFLIEGWVLLEGDQGGTESLIIGKGDGSAAGSSFFLTLVGDDSTSRNKLSFKWSDGASFTTVLSSPSPIEFGSFVHVAVQLFARQLKFFIGGAPAGSTTVPASAPVKFTTGTPVRFGRSQGDAPMQLVGAIDSIRFRRSTPEIYSGTFVPGEILPTAATKWLYYGALIPFVGAPGSTSATDIMGASVTFEGSAALDSSRWKHNGCSLKLDGAGSVLVARTDANDTDRREFSIECAIWLDRTVTRSANVVLFDSRGSNAGATAGFIIYVTPKNQIAIKDVATGYIAMSSNTESTNLGSGDGWHHVSANYSSEYDGVLFTIDGYIDMMAARKPWPVLAPPIDPSGLRIGRAADGSGGATCWLSDVRLMVGNYAYSASGQLSDFDKPFPSIPRYRL